MSERNLTAVQKAKKEKKEKPWKTCTWYPDQCDAVGCDCGKGLCSEYKDNRES